MLPYSPYCAALLSLNRISRLRGALSALNCWAYRSTATAHLACHLMAACRPHARSCLMLGWHPLQYAWKNSQEQSHQCVGVQPACNKPPGPTLEKILPNQCIHTRKDQTHPPMEEVGVCLPVGPRIKAKHHPHKRPTINAFLSSSLERVSAGPQTAGHALGQIKRPFWCGALTLMPPLKMRNARHTGTLC